jgi:hypothetical protein
MEAGYSEKVASAIAGNFAVETDNFKAMRPYDKTENSYGWAHWNGDRLKEFKEYANSKGLSIDSDEANLGYALKELQEGKHLTGGTSLLKQMEQAPNVAEAAKMFRAGYERPSVHNDPARVKYAQAAYSGADIPGAKTSAFVPGESYGVPAVVQPGLQKQQVPPHPQWQTQGEQVESTPVPTVGPMPSAGVVGPETEEQRAKRIEEARKLWMEQQEYLRKQEKPSGYGDMSHMKAGFAGLANPGYEDMSGYAGPAMMNLMQLLLSGRMGGQQEYANFMGQKL